MPTKYRKDYYDANKDKLRDRSKSYYYSHREKGREYTRRSNYKRKYGITVEQYNEIFEMQGGKCAICGKHQSVLSRPLGVDHDHYTKEVRGLLCNRCNFGIGFLDEDPVIFQKATSYLKRYYCEQ